MTEEEFDAEVATIRKSGVEPRQRHYRSAKRDCTPREWAANLEYAARRRALPGAKKHAVSLTRKWILWNSYGIVESQYDGMHAGQGGVCAVCGEGCATGRRLAVDHNHETGIVRGLLCSVCNTTAGKMKESPQLLRKLADYIEADGTQAFCLKTFYLRAMETTNERN